MRAAFTPLFLPFTAWLSALQALSQGVSLEQFARLTGLAGLLGTLTVLIYRLGVWRQEMENTKHTVVAELKEHREDSATDIGRIEQHLEALDHLVTEAASRRRRAARWQARIDRRLNRLERTTTTAVG